MTTFCIAFYESYHSTLSTTSCGGGDPRPQQIRGAEFPSKSYTVSFEFLLFGTTGILSKQQSYDGNFVLILIVVVQIFFYFLFMLKILVMWGLPPRNQWGPWPDDRQPTQKVRGVAPLSFFPSPSSLYCNLCINAHTSSVHTSSVTSFSWIFLEQKYTYGNVVMNIE